MSFRLFCIFLIFVTLRGGEGIWAQEEGLASYYHHRFHGRKSSSGRIHDKEELVAAHRTYPFGTFVRVTNLGNMKSAIVCVTDRGPRHRKRIIDVSASAAEILGFIDKGVAKVRIEVVPGPLDLRYLDLIYPKIPYLDIDYLCSDPPYRVKFTK
ncbi:MAG: septal ring lytic transglycosylase RlpA family protein [Parabacteroides sp.]|nr:septal ring lytic transglycosylase RlpA family protein [Parabacteroides sp.]